MIMPTFPPAPGAAPFDLAAWSARNPWPIRPADTEYVGGPSRRPAVMEAYQGQYEEAVQARHLALVEALFAHYAPGYSLPAALLKEAGALLTTLWATSDPPIPWGAPSPMALNEWLVGQAERLVAYTIAVAEATVEGL